MAQEGVGGYYQAESSWYSINENVTARECEDMESTLQVPLLNRRVKAVWLAIFALGIALISGLALMSGGKARNIKGTPDNEAYILRNQQQQAKAVTMPSPAPYQADTAFNYTAAALADEVHNLPGQPEGVTFRQFAGYLHISKNKHVFYWYVEAQTKPSKAPLTLWTNGGPGCSGLFGMLAENGPFRPNADGATLKLNPKSWNLLSNMVYVEIPIGVGFSYSDEKADYDIGDKQTAIDNRLVVETFLQRFPHLRPSEFYLTSESYGGHYIPTLAKEIVLKNQEEGQKELINLKGFAVGNPYTDPVENMLGMIDALWGRDLIPPHLYQRWVKTCQNSKDPDVYYSKPCVELQNEMWKVVGDVDPYALDWPVCKADSKHKAGRNQRHKLLSYTLSQFGSEYARASWNHLNEGLTFEPCEDDFLTMYLNRPDVKQALHAHPAIKWEDCTNRVIYQYHDQEIYMEPVYSFLVEEYGKLRILIYSGDDDSVCATQGTEMWLDSMHWKVKSKWHPWEVDGQVAGYQKDYRNGVVFCTVHEAGHEVPAFKPEAALHLFKAFLENKL